MSYGEYTETIFHIHSILVNPMDKECDFFLFFFFAPFKIYYIIYIKY